MSDVFNMTLHERCLIWCSGPMRRDYLTVFDEEFSLDAPRTLPTGSRKRVDYVGMSAQPFGAVDYIARREW